MMMVFMVRHLFSRALIFPVAMASGITVADAVDQPVRRDVIIAQRHVLDWVPLAELSSEQRQSLPPGSCGAYIAPVRSDPEATTYPDQAPLRALSDQTVMDESNPEGSKVLLLGDVEVQQGYRQIKAQRAQFDEASGVLTAEGPIEIREPGILMLGERTVVNRDDDILLIEEGVFVIHPANTRGSAKRLTKKGIESLVLEDASFTRCEPSSEAWALKGSKITLDFDARQGYARNVRLHVGGVPVFYFPYLRFPLGNERLSGFLAPSFEYGEDGTNVSIPYYFNLAPNYDALWTLHSIEQHGILNELNARHLSRHFYTQMNIANLNNDRGIPSDNAQSLINAGELTQAEAVPFKGEKRWVFNIDQVGGEGRPWSTQIDFTRVSDVNFFRDFNQTRFDHKDASTQTPIITGDRLRIDYDLTWAYEREWGFVKPNVSLKNISYRLDEREFAQAADASQTLLVPQFGLDTGLVFERQASRYTQTFEPRLFFFRSPYRSHDDLFDITTDGRDVDFDTSSKTFNFDQVFKNTRFSGGDRIDDANQVSLGLTTRFLGQQSGREWFSASLGQIFYFDDRRVTLDNTPETEKRSDIALQLRAKPTEHWQLSSDIIYDQADHKANSGNLGLTYTSPYDNLFDINYRYVRGATSDEDTRQVDASIIAPLLSHQWHLLWYGAYDITRDRELDLITALEYDGCCYSVRLGYRHWLDNSLVSTAADVDLQYEWLTFFEVHFYGLGSSGQQLDTFFEEKVDGYEQWRATHSKE